MEEKADIAKKRLGKVEEVSPAVLKLLKNVYLCEASSSFGNK